jgi:hypothetical protein
MSVLDAHSHTHFHSNVSKRGAVSLLYAGHDKLAAGLYVCASQAEIVDASMWRRHPSLG